MLTNSHDSDVAKGARGAGAPKRMAKIKQEETERGGWKEREREREREREGERGGGGG